jgi:hypothetical protein
MTNIKYEKPLGLRNKSTDRFYIEFDLNYYGLALTFGREDIYDLKNEITLQLLFWTFYIHF